MCATDPVALTASVVVRHARGGSVALAARAGVAPWAAVAGGALEFGASTSATPTAAASAPAATAPVAGPAGLIHEYPERVRGPDGVEYVIGAYARPRTHDTWIGWTRFQAIAGDRVPATDMETTRSKREEILCWASGLEPMYFEGACARARPTTAALTDARARPGALAP